jgi:hypothetical protein
MWFYNRKGRKVVVDPDEQTLARTKMPDPPPPTRNSAVLAEFVAYCEKNPGMRFWQALRNWANWGFIFVTNDEYYVYNDRKHPLYDTFYWESKIDGSNERRT